MTLAPNDIERRIRAKRLNERLKLSASSINTVGLTALAAAVIVPLTGGSLSLSALVWFLIAAGLHLVSHVVLGYLKSED